jgi:2-dehydro-3-deoxyphosphogluconate aldolase / (4S)-4-hydroxy-2-oxoglutarate aldolase
MTTQPPVGLDENRLLPLIDTDDIGLAVAAVRLLGDAGYALVEVGMRHPNAAETLRAAIEAAPQSLCVGAGTVVNTALLDEVLAIGAQFVVSPGVTSSLLEAFARCDVPALPGIATASELMMSCDAGFTTVKVFPATSVGLDTLAAWRGPFPTARFVPTGGIGIGSVDNWLALPGVRAVGGSFPTQLDRLKSSDTIGAATVTRELLARCSIKR